jgi:hypothetical protein
MSSKTRKLDCSSVLLELRSLFIRADELMNCNSPLNICGATYRSPDLKLLSSAYERFFCCSSVQIYSAHCSKSTFTVYDACSLIQIQYMTSSKPLGSNQSHESYYELFVNKEALPPLATVYSESQT